MLNYIKDLCSKMLSEPKMVVPFAENFKVGSMGWVRGVDGRLSLVVWAPRFENDDYFTDTSDSYDEDYNSDSSSDFQFATVKVEYESDYEYKSNPGFDLFADSSDDESVAASDVPMKVGSDATHYDTKGEVTAEV